MQQQNSSKDQLLNIAINILLPVLVLNQLGKRLGEDGPLYALIIAVSIPFSYGVHELMKTKKFNIFSILGLVNILLTGGLALLQLEGFWFAVKEAAFPLAIGIGVLISAFTSKPLIRLFILNDTVFDVELINNKLLEKGTENNFNKKLKTSTIYLSFSFYLSALLNYLLAIYIFVDIPASLSDLERSQVLNDQIAKMTWLSYFVILIPTMIVLALIMWHVSKILKDNTGLSINHLMRNHSD